MDKDSLASATLVFAAAVLIFFAIIAGAAILLPVIGVAVLGWFVFKGIQTYQTSKQTALLDAQLNQTIASSEQYKISTESFGKNFAISFTQGRIAAGKRLPDIDIAEEMIHAAEKLYDAEALGEAPSQSSSNDELAIARWRENVRWHAERVNDLTLVETIDHTIAASFNNLTDALPPLALLTHAEFRAALETDAAPLLQVPLAHVLPDIGEIVENTISSFYSQEAIQKQLFVELREQIDRNMHELSRVPYTDDNKGSPKLILPSEHKGTAEEIIVGYLKHTPLENIFKANVPFESPANTRFEHSWLCAGTGHGKTNAIATMLERDLEAVARGECSVVLMDSQNELIPVIAGLKQFAAGEPLHGKLVHIDPSDIEFPVQLNLFSIGTERLNAYSPLERERLLNSVIELYDFVLSALLGSEMTARQGTLFRFATQLMMIIPDATIHTFRELMQPGGYQKYKPYIEQLQGTAREFFDTQFNGKIFEQTKQQVVARLFTICENRTFERLFTHPKSKLDLFTELNSGKVILINTAKDLLKQQGTEVFGRFFLALIGQAAQERATLSQKKPVFCYVDECQDYIASDSNFTVILEQARKQKIAIIVAHQYLTQLSQQTLDSLYANTSTKYAGGTSDKDAHALARNMQTEPAFILRQSRGSFATYVRNYTQRAVSLKFPRSDLAKKPQMTEEEKIATRAASRALYAVPLAELSAPKAPAPPPAEEPQEFADKY